MIPKLDGWRAARLRGPRPIHTHLKDELVGGFDRPGSSPPDLVAPIGIDGNSLPTVIRIAHLLPDNPWRRLAVT
jgi:hypothetical protein